jgi:hypothetical protein
MSLTRASAAVIKTEEIVGTRNRIIYGAMEIDQRNAGASITPTDTGAFTYGLDRWGTFGSQSSKFSVQRNAGSVTPPAGFINYLGITSLAATTVGSSEAYIVGQEIEGFNVADLGWGTANAQPVTLSFWVRSSLTGTFGGILRNADNTRSYPFSYIISTANTWEYKTVTIAGDTTGTWLTNNGRGIRLSFGLGVGSTLSGTAGAWAGVDYRSSTGATSVVGTNGATWYVTGVQLEKGSTATPFERRQFGTELALCQRYYYNTAAQYGVSHQLSTCLDHIIYSSTESHGERFPTIMRAAPTVTLYGRGGLAGRPSITSDGSSITGTSTANSITYTGFRRIILGQTLSGYPAYALEVSYTAEAEL